MNPAFSTRTRKLIGLFVLLAWLTVYALAVMSFAVRFLDAGLFIETIFYVVAGFAWIMPLKPLLFWMQKSNEPAEQDDP